MQLVMTPIATLTTCFIVVGMILFIISAFIVRRSGAMSIPDGEIIDIMNRLNAGEEVLLEVCTDRQLKDYLSRLEIEQDGIREFIEFSREGDCKVVIRLVSQTPEDLEA